MDVAKATGTAFPFTDARRRPIFGPGPPRTSSAVSVVAVDTWNDPCHKEVMPRVPKPMSINLRAVAVAVSLLLISLVVWYTFDIGGPQEGKDSEGTASPAAPVKQTKSTPTPVSSSENSKPISFAEFRTKYQRLLELCNFLEQRIVDLDQQYPLRRRSYNIKTLGVRPYLLGKPESLRLEVRENTNKINKFLKEHPEKKGEWSQLERISFIIAIQRALAGENPNGEDLKQILIEHLATSAFPTKLTSEMGKVGITSESLSKNIAMKEEFIDTLLSLRGDYEALRKKKLIELGLPESLHETQLLNATISGISETTYEYFKNRCGDLYALQTQIGSSMRDIATSVSNPSTASQTRQGVLDYLQDRDPKASEHLKALSTNEIDNKNKLLSHLIVEMTSARTKEQSKQ